MALFTIVFIIKNLKIWLIRISVPLLLKSTQCVSLIKSSSVNLYCFSSFSISVFQFSPQIQPLASPRMAQLINSGSLIVNVFPPKRAWIR